MSMDYYIAFRRKHFFAPLKKPEPQHGELADDPRMDAAKWVGFVEAHSGILTWFENTPQGKLIGQDPKSAFKDLLGKTTVQGEWDKKYSVYKFQLNLYEYTIEITFDGMRPNKKYLMLCFELAQAMGANLFKAGKVVTDTVLNEM